MKRIFAIILCALLIGIMPIVASADEIVPEETPTVDETVTETPTETTTETVTETTAPADESVPEKTATESFVEWVKSNLGYIATIATSVILAVVAKVIQTKTTKSIGTINNNAIAIANTSADVAQKALSKVDKIAARDEKMREDIQSLLSVIQKSEDEKRSLETTLSHVETFLKTAKLATLELSNEVAELLVLANIPVSKKDELYARHTKAVHELEAVEEVMSDERAEA